MATIRWFMVTSERYKIMMSRVLLILWLLCSPTCSFEATLNLPQVDEWANDIGKNIWSLAENVSGSGDLRQAYQDSLKEVATIDLTRLLNDSARKMEQYFSKKIVSLQRIKERAEKAYGEQINETVQAADVKYVDMINLNGSSINVSLTYDRRFKTRVNTSYSGIQIPANVYNRGAKVLKTIKFSAELDEVFKDNLKNKDPSLKWQYFGSHDAVFRTYPAKNWTNQYYSARRRPWYTQGAASPKNVIILIDSSGSMLGKRSLIARVAVSNLIDTFSENDFFNVLYFNTDVKSLSCNRTLVQASKRNREWIKLKLSSTSTNSANWELALTEAFKMLEESSGANCQKMIMIFSDGTETKEEKVFEKYNQDKKVRVFAYLVGTASHASSDLMWMACSNKGYYYEVRTVGAVRDLIEDYVSVLSRPMASAVQQNPVWTGVYRDASGLGMMVTGTLPVFYNGEFLGVCGTDVTVDELENAVYQPYLGADGYSFLINNNGHIVKHPNLRSMLGYVESAGDVDLLNAEFVPSGANSKLLNLRERMLLINDGEMDEQTLNVFLFTEYNHYLRAIPTQRHYIFTRIKRTPFSLALASSHFGYNVTQYQPFVIGSDQYNSNATVFLENWQHCTKNLPLKTTIQELRRLISDEECNGNLLLDLNITENMETVWKTKNISQYNISLAFVKTNWGLQRLSEPLRENIITENLFQRIRSIKNDTVIVTAPYNSGGRMQDTDPNLLIYKGIQIDVSDMKIIPAVSGFLIKEENFVKEYLRNISSKDSYHVYLLDENAFIVSSSLNSSSLVTGQFFGSVDWELMAELEKGEGPLYRRFTFRNEQGECPVFSSKASSSSMRYPFYSSIATFFSTWTRKVLACILQFNLYNWIFVDANTQTNQQAQSSTAKSNRTCVTNMTTYFGNITNWKSFSGNTSCLDCGSSEEFRRFFVAPVQHTNLVLVVVEHFAEKAIFQYTKKKEGIPGKHVEISIEHDKCRSNSSLSRRLPMRCELSEEQETNYSCGKAQVFGPNIILLVITNVLYFIVQLNRLHRK